MFKKRVGSAVVALALSVSCMAVPVANAFEWVKGTTASDVIAEKLDAVEIKAPELSAEEKEALFYRLTEAFESGDFTDLSFYERTAVFDDDMFAQFMEDAGLSKRQKKSLLKSRTGAFDVVEIERDIEYKAWIESAEFDEFLDNYGLTDAQVQGIKDSKVTFNDSAILNAYLRQLGLDEKERDDFRAAVHTAYEKALYGGLTAPVGYDAENFQFDAFVEMLEAGEFDDLLAKRDKDSKKFSAKDKLGLAKKFDACLQIDEGDVYTGMRAKFASLSEAEKE